MQDKGVQVGSSSDRHAVRLVRSKQRRQVVRNLTIGIQNVQEKFQGVQVGLGIGWSVGLVRLDNTAAW